jgi:hypothetical protein
MQRPTGRQPRNTLPEGQLVTVTLWIGWERVLRIEAVTSIMTSKRDSYVYTARSVLEFPNSKFTMEVDE